MEKRYGASGPQVGLEKIGRKRWALFYGFGKDSEDAESGFNWYHVFDHRPDFAEVRKLILDTINKETDRRILQDFVWKDMPVWLSTENQFNYKAAYDLAVQSDGASLPVRFKFGTDSDPVYHVFDTVAELADFYTAAMKHISDTLAAGWAEKDSLDTKAFDAEG